jgi:hypothetical protein
MLICIGEQESDISGWKRVIKELDPVGFYHYRREGDDTRLNTTPPRPANTIPATPAHDWEKSAKFYHEDRHTHESIADLEGRLGIPANGLLLYHLLGCNGCKSINGVRRFNWTFPEVDGSENVVGINVRYPAEGNDEKDEQEAMKGSRRGLMITDGWRDRPGPLFIVEGASDTIALAAAGLAAVGRPGAESGTKPIEYLVELLRDWPTDRSIIIVAERDKKKVGEKGAAKLAKELSGKLSRPIAWGFPPDNAKDSRAWMIAEQQSQTDWAGRGDIFSAGVQASMVTIECTDSKKPPLDPNKTVTVTPREMEVNDKAIELLAAYGDVYQRGGFLVNLLPLPAEQTKYHKRPEGLRIVIMDRHSLREHLSHVAYWVEEKPVKESAKEKGDGVTDQIKVPTRNVDSIRSRGHWKDVRPLTAIMNHPVLREDGTIVTHQGYDEQTGIFISPACPFITINKSISKVDARKAIDVLLEPVVDFPFASSVSKAAWIAGVLTPLARHYFKGSAPLFFIKGNTPGCGKGLLATIISLIVNGNSFSVTEYIHDSREFAKCILASLASGDRMILFDNVSGPFGNKTLDFVLTNSELTGRVLGETRNTTLSLADTTWYATGNNPLYKADTSRRLIEIVLDSKEEFPDQRTGFTHGSESELCKWVLENRTMLLTAAIEVLVGFHHSGETDLNLKAFGSFNSWSDTVRAAVYWACEVDAAENREKLRREDDADAAAMATVLSEWDKIDHYSNGLTIAQFVDKVFGKDKPDGPFKNDLPDLRAAIGELVKEPTTKTIGYKFRQYINRYFNGKCITSIPYRAGSVKWCISYQDSPEIGFTGYDETKSIMRNVLTDGGDGGDGGDTYTQGSLGNNSNISYSNITKRVEPEVSPPSPPSPPSTHQFITTDIITIDPVEPILLEAIAASQSLPTNQRDFIARLCEDVRNAPNSAQANAVLMQAKSMAKAC